MPKNDEIITQLELETKLSDEKRTELLKYFVKQNVCTQLQIMKEQKNEFFKLKSQNKESSTLSLSSLILSIKKLYELEKEGLKKNTTLNIENIGDKSSLKILENRKIRLKVKREKLLNLWAVVKQLRTNDYSYREIKDYLSSKHRFEVSHTFVRNMWEEFENEHD